MTIEKNGAQIIISDIIAGQRISKQYWYYTRREAIKLFKEHPDVRHLTITEKEKRSGY